MLVVPVSRYQHHSKILFHEAQAVVAVARFAFAKEIL